MLVIDSLILSTTMSKFLPFFNVESYTVYYTPMFLDVIRWCMRMFIFQNDKSINTMVEMTSAPFSSVTQSCLILCDPHGLQHTRPPCPSPTPRAYSNSHPSSRWCHPTISSSVVPFTSRLWSFPASGSFVRSQLISSGGQSIGVSASASILPINTQDWSPLGWTGRISLQSKGLSRVFSNTTVQKHQFFGTQLSL